ncbi:protein kinase domain-containing protein [Variovorax boronicumulans]|uniref:protein kinase domain-containing protein n=1 Tax=Variovorax boronicumulans TaxID=436515 RepID=UPI0027825327|nr:protein kinase [Variovorax boronicumulans]MDQ0042246.1 serine/threonine protein kinase [Variovorax boronicumulans]
MINVRKLDGQMFRGWNIQTEIGHGADGIVYKATQEERVVALKLFFPEAVQKNGIGEEQERLELQLGLAGEKHHPHLVEIYEGGIDEESQTLYLAMEYVPGNSLDKILDTLPRQAIAPLLKQLADAARFLHEQGLAHRDIKPANIVVSDDFLTLTLLDLGVATRDVENADDQKLSGDEFVASVRYSPPEFVWRTEARSEENAWTAISYYQIGATLHDMLMKKPIFQGFDSPRAKLYDAVRLRAPEIEALDCEPWLAQIARACLVKSWRERLKIVTWDLFAGPPPTGGETSLKLLDIRLRQVLADQEKIRLTEEKAGQPRPDRAQELWRLQSDTFLRVRQFLMTSDVFPRFSGTHEQSANSSYTLKYQFEENPDLLFKQSILIEIIFAISPSTQLTTDLTLIASIKGEEITRSSWSEAFTVETAADLCQRAIVQVAEQMLESQ